MQVQYTSFRLNDKKDRMFSVWVLMLLLMPVAFCVGHRLVAQQPPVATGPRSRKQQSTVAYFPAHTVLQGMLRKERRYGPPNFGETPKTDQQVPIVVLILKHPVRAVPEAHVDRQRTSNLNVIAGVSAVQLFFEGDTAADCEATADGLIGKQVTVEGTVNEAVTATDFTRLTMSVTKITAH